MANQCVAWAKSPGMRTLRRDYHIQLVAQFLLLCDHMMGDPLDAQVHYQQADYSLAAYCNYNNS